MPVHLQVARATSRPSYWPSRGRRPLRAQLEQVHEEVVGQRTRASSVSTPSDDPPVVRAQHAQAADEDGHLGRAEGQQVRAVEQQVLGRQPVALAAGSCGTRRRSARARRRTRRRSCSCDASVRPGVNGTSTSTPASRAACSTPAQPASTIRSASETGLPKRRLDPLERAQHRGELVGVVDLPAASAARGGCARRWRRRACRCRGTSRPTPTRWRPAGTTVRPESRICRLSAATSSAPIELVVDRGDRVLPDQRLAPGPPGRGSARSAPCRGASA